MISIIICSKSPRLLQKVTASIEQTIGVPYEIIAIENGRGQMGICKAYNKGAAQAKYKYLCFSHEDVVFHTNDWGKNLVAHLSIPEVGAIGICGCTIKPKSPSGVSLWYGEVNRTCMLQTGSDGKPFQKYTNPFNEVRSEVKTLDGVFLCCRKEVWQQHKFDEQNFQNFHGYDIDFSLQVSTQHKNYVVYDVILEHSSEGHNNVAWIESVVRMSKKWDAVLPASTTAMDKKELRTIEHKSYFYFLEEAIRNKVSVLKLLPYYAKLIRMKPIDADNLRIIKRYLFS